MPPWRKRNRVGGCSLQPYLPQETLSVKPTLQTALLWESRCGWINRKSTGNGPYFSCSIRSVSLSITVALPGLFLWETETERRWDFWETAEGNNAFWGVLCPLEKSCFGSLCKFQLARWGLILCLSKACPLLQDSDQIPVCLCCPLQSLISLVNSAHKLDKHWGIRRTLSMRLQNQGNWQMMGWPVMPLGWDTDILNHTSANGIYHFEMVYFLI